MTTDDSAMMRFLEVQARFSNVVAGDGLSARLAALRADGRAAFERIGFPDRKHEEWRFTPIASVMECDPEPADSPEATLLVQAARRLDELKHEFEGGIFLAFVNGFFQGGLSDVLRSANGPIVENLLSSEGDVAFRFPTEAEDPFEALNASFLREAAIIRLPPGVAMGAPIVVVNFYGGAKAVYPRIHAVCGAGGACRLIEIHEELDAEGAGLPAAAVSIAAVSVEVGERAHVEHVRLERHLSTRRLVTISRIVQAGGSELATTVLTYDATFVRNSLRVEMAGEQGICRMNGLYLVKKTELVDNHTAIDHAVPHCESHELYKGILDGSGRAVFNGRILVRKDAQKTAALQTNRNLVLSDDAVIDTKPQLEIFADDVKCSHGATVGQLDQEALFYLRSRAIPEAEARRLLLHAFAREIIERVGIDSAIPILDREVQASLGCSAETVS